MNIMPALMAGANFSQGYFQGQDQDVQARMQKLALQNAQLQEETQARKMQQAQALSDYAMHSFTPSIPGIPGITSPAIEQGPGVPGGSASPDDSLSPGQPSTAPMDPIQQTEDLASKALSLGDISTFSELSTNAANMRSAKYMGQERQAAADLSEARRQTQNYSQVASLFSTLDPDSPTFAKDFEDAKTQAMALPSTTQEESKNIASWQPSPELAQRITQMGMSASQRAALKQREIMDQQKQQRAQFDEDMARRRDAREERLAQLKEKAALVKGKVGAIVSPSKEDLATAAPIIQDIVFPNGGVNPDDPNYTQALTTLASRAKVFQKNNPGVPFSTAVSTVASEAKRIGEFSPAMQDSTILGIKTGGKEPTGNMSFKPRGDSPDTALPFPGKNNTKNLIPGKYYNVPGHGVMLFGKNAQGVAGFSPAQ